MSDVAKMDVALGPELGQFGRPRKWNTRCHACQAGRSDECSDEQLGHDCIQRIKWNYGSCQHREILFGSVDQVTYVGRCAYCGFLVPN